MVCPYCGHDRLRRTSRVSFLENKIFPLVGIYPWECANCRQHYLRRKRYERLKDGGQPSHLDAHE